MAWPSMNVGGSGRRISSGGGRSIQFWASSARSGTGFGGPGLQQRAARRGAGTIGSGIGHLGGVGVGVERGDGGQQLPLALVDRHPAGRERPPVAHPVDLDLQRLAGHAGLDEVGVQRVQRLVGDRGAGRDHGLGQHLPAEDLVEPAEVGDDPEAIVARRLQHEGRQEGVEGVVDGGAEDVVGSVDRRRRLGVLGRHGTWLARRPRATSSVQSEVLDAPESAVAGPRGESAC